VKKKRTGLKITLGVLGLVLVLCCGGITVFAIPILQEYPATVSAPETLDGMTQLTDSTIRNSADKLRDDLKTKFGADNAIAAIYAPSGDRTKPVFLVAATHLIINPESQLDEAFDSLGTSRVNMTNATTVDPGSMGGYAKCGEAKISGITVGTCAWADHGSVGIVMAFNQDAARTGALLRTARPLVLDRG
jgi:hypothetical protein